MGRLEFKNKKDDIGKIEYTEENILFALNNYFYTKFCKVCN